MMRTMLALRLSGYGRETKRPAIGYGQRPENSQRADGWAEGEGLGMDVRGEYRVCRVFDSIEPEAQRARR
jgi:hypothetical protein